MSFDFSIIVNIIVKVPDFYRSLYHYLSCMDSRCGNLFIRYGMRRQATDDLVMCDGGNKQVVLNQSVEKGRMIPRAIVLFLTTSMKRFIQQACCSCFNYQFAVPPRTWVPAIRPVNGRPLAVLRPSASLSSALKLFLECLFSFF
ncbi:hypothetical protein Ancab_021757 [Ancistrocladus abbreviatus]